MGVNTTKELCGICLDNVMHDKSRRKRASSPDPGGCGCHSKPRQSRQKSDVLTAAEAMMDAICLGGSVSAAGANNVYRAGHRSPGTSPPESPSYKSSTGYGSSYQQHRPTPRYRQHQPFPYEQQHGDSVAHRTDAIMTIATTPDHHTDEINTSSSSQKHAHFSDDIRAQQQRPSRSQRSQDHYDSNDTEDDTGTTTPACSATLDTTRAIGSKKEQHVTNKEPFTMILVSPCTANQNYDPRANSSDTSPVEKHAPPNEQGTSDSHSTRRSLLDDNSSCVSMVSSCRSDMLESEADGGGGVLGSSILREYEHAVGTKKPFKPKTDEASSKNKITAKHINRFLEKLSKDKLAMGMPNDLDASTVASSDILGVNNSQPDAHHHPISMASLEEVPSSLPPLKFDSRRTVENQADPIEESRDDKNGVHSQQRLPEGFLRDDEDDDDDDDITGPCMAPTESLETLGTLDENIDPALESTAPTISNMKKHQQKLMDTTHHVQIAPPSDVGTSDHNDSLVVPINTARSTMTSLTASSFNVATPTGPQIGSHPSFNSAPGKERREIFLMKDQLQWTMSKLESTQYELNVMKGIKDLYQRELECKAMECKLAEWRLNHKPLAIDASDLPPDHATLEKREDASGAASVSSLSIGEISKAPSSSSTNDVNDVATVGYGHTQFLFQAGCVGLLAVALYVAVGQNAPIMMDLMWTSFLAICTPLLQAISRATLTSFDLFKYCVIEHGKLVRVASDSFGLASAMIYDVASSLFYIFGQMTGTSDAMAEFVDNVHEDLIYSALLFSRVVAPPRIGLSLARLGVDCMGKRTIECVAVDAALMMSDLLVSLREWILG
ncbi:expressed unknown protein [Seminavis robusta]|uniref:Uncharacterized protein n=1 Tax=Seminavis robusta TaxID=568900 RepID=A0A9N8DZ60_9STRA|nr:expressed unknown protein [Seminavis robusta]|eukprot:Sro467_g148990.1 n/a (838) ;mRNA; r:55260-57773